MEQAGEGPGQVLGEADGRGGDGRGEADEERDPAGEEAEDGVVEAGEEGVLAAGVRDGGPELAVAQGAAEGDQAADEPEGEHDDGLVEVLHQQARRREDAGADHVGDDDVGEREEPELALEPVRGGSAGHVRLALQRSGLMGRSGREVCSPPSRKLYSIRGRHPCQTRRSQVYALRDPGFAYGVDLGPSFFCFSPSCASFLSRLTRRAKTNRGP